MTLSNLAGLKLELFGEFSSLKLIFHLITRISATVSIFFLHCCNPWEKARSDGSDPGRIEARFITGQPKTGSNFRRWIQNQCTNRGKP